MTMTAAAAVMLLALSAVAAPAHGWALDKKQCADEHRVMAPIRAEAIRATVQVPCIRIPINKGIEQPIEVPIHLHARVPIEAEIDMPLRLPLHMPIHGSADVAIDAAVGTSVDVPVSVPFNQRVDVRTHTDVKPVSYQASLKCWSQCNAGHQVCKERCGARALGA